MAEVKSIEFNYKEVAEALIKHNDIHEGLWGISIKFGIQAANISAGPGEDLTPAAIVPVLKIGLQKFEEENSLSVDAAKVNPSKKRNHKK